MLLAEALKYVAVYEGAINALWVLRVVLWIYEIVQDLSIELWNLIVCVLLFSRHFQNVWIQLLIPLWQFYLRWELQVLEFGQIEIHDVFLFLESADHLSAICDDLIMPCLFGFDIDFLPELQLIVDIISPLCRGRIAGFTRYNIVLVAMVLFAPLTNWIYRIHFGIGTSLRYYWVPVWFLFCNL